MLENEEWIPAVGFEGFYEVSTHGRVRSSISKSGTSVGHVRTPCLNRAGYHQLILCMNCKRFSRTVHSLVAKTFIPNPLNLPQVNHKDGVKSNNSVENLEWTTAKGNRIHARDTGLHKPAHGRGCWNAKLSDDAVRDIRNRYIPWKVTMQMLADEYGVTTALIGLVVARKKWKHVP